MAMLDSCSQGAENPRGDNSLVSTDIHNPTEVEGAHALALCDYFLPLRRNRSSYHFGLVTQFRLSIS
ncbi:hypothetical protein EB796_012298 [Bugula neritina]|uniref:Uncharacterized protein n=1 Tax=Bugula neritina TaxID=10212 RepID=A0A7J7JSU2_BUGNE|nr:hypothetical protein EB796_012298 [Bugula neritina]